MTNQTSRPQTLTRMTLKDSAEELVRGALLDGSMQPGEIYSANALARRLGVSNSPVREAMMALAARGLLDPVRNRGFRVVRFTEQDKQEVYDLRCHIEVEAVRRVAAQRIDPEDASALRDHARQTLHLAKNADLTTYLNADHAFHLDIVGRLGNNRWLEFVATLRDQARINGAYAYLQDHAGLMQSAREHIEMAEAIADGQPDRAAEVMLKHLEYARPT
ncbi:GntR family transcriptional regulator [Propioniferax innocua]|uniref:GntR family transcriptional regulator n=1 Tax=Propioniferax innocua TaxID=1753 RepID=A0A542ZQA3_9ACTN|nr:GntR family transcriptional regulator [Propioniferax innocua]TQL62524.1 GntR family transcriptional regulator [Propioniferax innocua]